MYCRLRLYMTLGVILTSASAGQPVGVVCALACGLKLAGELCHNAGIGLAVSGIGSGLIVVVVLGLALCLVYLAAD